MDRSCAVLFLFFGSVSFSDGASALDTTTYTYDVLGRLTASTVAGGPNNAIQTATCFDTAGNRVQYSVTAGAPPGCSAPPVNHPPVCANKTLVSGVPIIAGPVSVPVPPISFAPACTDADGDTLSLTSATGFTRGASGTISGNQVNLTNVTSGGGTTFTYTVSDGHGGSVSAQFTFQRN